MNSLTLWYARLSRKARITLICGGVIIALVALAIASYMVLVPKKVQVTYGTRVVDPIDGHVWEDNTQTIWVSPSEAGNYHVEVQIKYSEAHLTQLEQQEAEREQQQAAIDSSSGYELQKFAVPTQQLEDLETIKHNMDVVGQTVITGMDVANQIEEIKNYLIQFRNQAADYPLPSELESLRQQLLQPLDMVIQACDLYIQAIATADSQFIDQANELIRQATVIWQDLMAKYQDLFSDLEQLIPDLQNSIPSP
jgi:putative lipoic acid-binding regulatory protein